MAKSKVSGELRAAIKAHYQKRGFVVTMFRADEVAGLVTVYFKNGGPHGLGAVYLGKIAQEQILKHHKESKRENN